MKVIGEINWTGRYGWGTNFAQVDILCEHLQLMELVPVIVNVTIYT